MKRLLFFVLMMLLIVLPLMADMANQKPAYWDIITPLVLLIATPLIVRLFKKIGIDIAQDQLDPILIKIMEIIAQVEEHSGSDGGERKKLVAVTRVKKVLSGREIQLLERRYGSLETAVQAAFEMSSTALK